MPPKNMQRLKDLSYKKIRFVGRASRLVCPQLENALPFILVKHNFLCFYKELTMQTSLSSTFATSSRLGRLGKTVVHASLALVLGLGASAQAADAMHIDDTGNAKSEMAACMSGKTQQDKKTCMTEARNAQAARRAGKLSKDNMDYSANAMKRCDIFKNDEDQRACKARLSNSATLDGSVASGGVLREAEITVPAKAE